MKTVTLTRVAYNDDATPGVLKVEDELFYTLELPYINNERNISCIPEGEYIAKPRKSPSRKTTVYELEAVPGRSNIQIHIGNTTDDIEGCILVGNKGSINKVFNSVDAFRELKEKLNNEKILIKIRSI